MVAKIKMIGMLLLALVAGSVSQVQAFDLTANSADNEVFLLLLNENPGGVFHSISVNVDAPAFISNTIEVTNTPGAINGGGSDLVVLQFDVGNAAFNTSGDLIVTVSGMVAGNAVSVDFTVPLRVWFSAPAAQGFVGTGEPSPNPGGTDTDGDGVPDSLEVAYGSDPSLASSIPGQIDSDGDGIEDGSDPAPSDPCNPSTFVTVCDFDTDSDGKFDRVEGQSTDTDSDGAADYIESSLIDDDGDGVSNELDANNSDPCIPSPFGTNCTVDTDGDGVSDAVEGEFTDTDSDGAPDYTESALLDDDGDGVSNELDANNSDPCIPSTFGTNCTVDTDGDGASDAAEGEFTDTDSDGIYDYQESSLIDSDSDGVADELDPANGDPCNPDPLAPGCSVPEADVPLFGLSASLLLAALLAIFGVVQVQRRSQEGVE
ncbi:MSCRAMM family adhesin SdrC [Pseudomonadales bacterium]|nr:MSCRAMM family adhesin SdrC [Pseudomonadales bacterium]